MLTFDDKGGGQKTPKTCLRNTWMFPQLVDPKWDVKNDFAYVLQFLSLISDGLGCVRYACLFRSLNVLLVSREKAGA